MISGKVDLDDGNILEGDPDETFNNTLYRFLVLFGIPATPFQQKKCPLVWKAMRESFDCEWARPVRKKSSGFDMTQYNRDCKEYSIHNGNNVYIARARIALQSMKGGLDLLFHLCSFDPSQRATAMQTLNSTFFESLRVDPSTISPSDTKYSYTSFATQS